jgi:hypothetical protein
LPVNFTEQVFVDNRTVVLIHSHVVKVVLYASRNFVLIKVNDPKGCLFAVTAVGLFENLTFTNVFHPDVVEFAPLSSVVVLDKGVVVAGLRAAIVHANSVNIVSPLFVFDRLERKRNLAFDSVDLRLKFTDLFLCCLLNFFENGGDT